MNRNRKRGREAAAQYLPPPTTGDAVDAVHATAQRLTEARSMWPRINRVSSTLSRELEENNFAGRIRRAMGGPH